jgi:prophage maintenance system killer protein
MFLALNGHHLEVGADNAVNLMVEIASGRLDEAAVTHWLAERVEPTR